MMSAVWNGMQGFEFCPGIFHGQSYRMAHDLNLCCQMLPAVLCFLFAVAVRSQGSTVVTSWLIQVLNVIRDKRVLCSPHRTHLHWHLSSILLSMCRRSMEEWPHLKGDHWPSGAKVKNNKYVLHAMHRDNINFISCYGYLHAYTSYVNLDGKVHHCHHLLLPD